MSQDFLDGIYLGTGHYLSPGGGAEYFCCYIVEIT